MSKLKKILILLIMVVVSGVVICYWLILSKKEPETIIYKEPPYFLESENKRKTILFVGDMMFDRGVESLMKKNGNLWPFEKISPFLKNRDIVFGNLEGPIVKDPPDFGLHSLQFAFSSEIVEVLSASSFNLLSLANNHTQNMGEEGLKETKELLAQANIGFLGEPVKCDEGFSAQRENIIFLAFNKTFPINCSDQKIEEIIKKIRDENPEKFIVVIFHWGEEYQSKSSAAQTNLAHKVIEAGADLIIGSHPHVVQEIEEYQGKLIFYSLGNFIFDQYFSKEVQEGLMVDLEIYPQKLVYKLFPVKTELSQPFLMGSKETNEFLESLAQNSSSQLKEEIKRGIIEIPLQKENPSSSNVSGRDEELSLEKEQKSGTKTKSNFIDPENQLVHHLLDINDLPSPKAVKFASNGKEIWVTALLNKKRGVIILNPLSGVELNDINLENGGGVEIIFSKDNKKAYVSQMETAKVFEIDTVSQKVLRSFDTGSTWTKVLLLSSDEKTLFASNWVGDDISEIDINTGKLNRLIPTLNTPRGMYLTKNDEVLYIAGFANGEIEKINLKTGEKKIIFKSGGAMRHIVGDEEKGVLYISDMAKSMIWKVFLENDRVEGFVQTDTNPNTIVLSPDKKILFVSCRGENFSADNYSVPGPEWGSVLLFDTESGAMLDAIIGGDQPTGLDISPDGKLLAFSDFLNGRLEIFEVPSYEELKQGNGGRSKIYKTELRK